MSVAHLMSCKIIYAKLYSALLTHSAYSFTWSTIKPEVLSDVSFEDPNSRGEITKSRVDYSMSRVPQITSTVEKCRTVKKEF